MISQIVNTIFLIVLFSLSFGIGLSLVIDDFKRAILNPVNVIIGFFIRGLLLPLFAFIISRLFEMPPELTIGLVLVVSCSGGVTSNLFTSVAGGDVALSVTLTALSSISTIITAPIVLSLLLRFYNINPIEAPFSMVDIIGKLFLLIIVPIAGGMFVQRYLSKQLSKKIYTVINTISLVTLVLAIISQAIKYRHFIADKFVSVGIPVILLQFISIVVMFSLAFIVTKNRKSSIAIGLESTVQNCIQVLAVVPLLGGLASEDPVLYYGVFMYVTVLFSIFIFKKWNFGPENFLQVEG